MAVLRLLEMTNQEPWGDDQRDHEVNDDDEKDDDDTKDDDDEDTDDSGHGVRLGCCPNGLE